MHHTQIAAIVRIILGTRPAAGWTLGEIQDAINRAGRVQPDPMPAAFRAKVWADLNAESAPDDIDIAAHVHAYDAI